MTTSEISAQYTTGLSRPGIERALLDAGKRHQAVALAGGDHSLCPACGGACG